MANTVHRISFLTQKDYRKQFCNQLYKFRWHFTLYTYVREYVEIVIHHKMNLICSCVRSSTKLISKWNLYADVTVVVP